MKHDAPVRFVDLSPSTDTLLEDVLAGLSQCPRMIPSKYLYDARGSELFDRITELEVYYPTRTELAILERHVDEMAACIGPHVLLVEFGSGSGIKTRILLEHLDRPFGYVPIDISRDHLLRSATELASRYEGLVVQPVCADYTTAFELPVPERADNRAVYYPGSTIGNFTPPQATAFLARVGEICGPGGGLLIGVDLKKDADVLQAAYDDDLGITAAFNKNVLVRLNREAGADFDIDGFEHEAVYDAGHGRIEMHLVCARDQQVRVGDAAFHLKAGERIVTEYSYKFTIDEFAVLAHAAGFDVERVWTDAHRLFSVQYLRRL